MGDANGTPDATFDGDGFATFGKAYLEASAVLLKADDKADDKIIVVGIQTASFVRTLILARLTSAGALDTTWNGTGLVEVPSPIRSSTNATHRRQAHARALRRRRHPSAFALQPDGKLVVTGRTWTPTGGNDAALLRLK